MKEAFLLEIDKYPIIDKTKVVEALDFATKHHEGQFRKSGQPYIIHPIHVAMNLLDFCLVDTDSIIAALLHDTIEDTSATYEEIEKTFGTDVAVLVDGVTKLSKISFKTEEQSRHENFRKFIIYVSKDLRVLLIKLSDRLHNMKTIMYLDNKEKRERIAKETIDIYIPLAERIGLNMLKDELEDLAFNVLYPEIRATIIDRLELYKSVANINLLELEKEISSVINKSNVNFSIAGRLKRPYSIWRKMEQKDYDFEDIMDLVAFRIIVNNVEDCYKVLGILHVNFKTFFGSFRDYISIPKENNYMSLHTCVIVSSICVEFQIKTEEMHNIAERGIAAHWNYKNRVKSYNIQDYIWLRNIIDIVNSKDLKDDEKLEYTRLEIFQEEIFVFTPKGDIITLPRDSVVLDFAYSIHSDIGDSCVGAKVNGEFLNPYDKLENGQVVKIITVANKEPDFEAIDVVKTATARNCIRRFWRNIRLNKIETIITNFFEEYCKQKDLDFNISKLNKAMDNYTNNKYDFYENLLQGKVEIDEIFKVMYPDYIIKDEDYSNIFFIKDPNFKKFKIEIAECCYPAKGDQIIGINILNQSIKIHRKDCKNILTNKDNEFSKKIDITWKYGFKRKFLAKLQIEVDNKPGVINKITEVIYKKNINIKEFYTEDVKNFSIAYIFLLIEVEDVNTINLIMGEIKKIPFTKNIKRYFNN